MESNEHPLDGQNQPEALQKQEHRPGLLTRFSGGVRGKLAALVLAVGSMGDALPAAETSVPAPAVQKRVLSADEVKAIRSSGSERRFRGEYNSETKQIEYTEMTAEEILADEERIRALEAKKKSKKFTRPRTSRALTEGVRTGHIDISEGLELEDGESPELPMAADPAPVVVLKPVAGQAEVKADRIDVPQHVKDLEAEMKRADPRVITIDHGYEANNKHEQVVRLPGIVKPIGYKPILVRIEARAYSNGKTKVMLPCPRDVGDQIHVGCIVKHCLEGQSTTLGGKIVYSEAPNGGGFHNPLVLVDLSDSKLKGINVILLEQMVLMPVYPEVRDEQILAAMGGNAARILATVQSGAKIPWTPDFDCLDKADVVRANGGGLAEVLEGFSFRSPRDAEFGGKHCINFIRTPDRMMTADPRTLQDQRIGTQDRFVATGVGSNYVVKEWSKNPIRVSNGGCFKNASDFKAASAQSYDLDPAKMGPHMKNYADALWAERMKVYDPKIAAAEQQANVNK